MVEYVGLDVSKQETHFCVKDGSGLILAEGKAARDPVALFEVLREHTFCPRRIVLESGSLSPWLARGMVELGLPAAIIDACEAHGVMKLQRNKSDANDARLLADICRCNPGRVVDVGSEEHARQTMVLRPANIWCASSMLCVVHKNHPLKTWARAIKKRSCHKKACVALARRMTVILHKMLVKQESFRWPQGPQEKHSLAKV